MNTPAPLAASGARRKEKEYPHVNKKHVMNSPQIAENPTASQTNRISRDFL
jgi:hypothetical protein